MKYEIHGDKLLITDAIKTYIEEKLSKLNKYFEHSKNITARIVLRVRGRNQIIEVTIPTHSFILRNEEAHSDLYAAIDLVTDKLERQIVKNQKKMQNKTFKSKVTDFNFDSIVGEDSDDQFIVKRKKLETKPMSEEEAIIQMNMLGHDFFIYKNDETNNIDVLYKRKDGNYGIIETK
jgi:putative sigma-54 modulation protein